MRTAKQSAKTNHHADSAVGGEELVDVGPGGVILTPPMELSSNSLFLSLASLNL